MNALIKAPIDSRGLVLYTTTAPCLNCAKLILNSSVRQLYYRRSYRDTAGIILLMRYGIRSESLSLVPRSDDGFNL